MKDKMKFYQQMSVEEKKKVRAMIDDLNKTRKQQIKLLEDGIMQPLRECILAGEKFKKNEITAQHYIHKNTEMSKRIDAFFGGK